MPTRLYIRLKCGPRSLRTQFARMAAVRYLSRQAITPAPRNGQMEASHPIKFHLDTQPPSLKPPEFRRSQLHRQYTSLIKSTPLMVLFQHNNLTALEWTGIRRELYTALAKIDDGLQNARGHDRLCEHIKLQIIKTGVFGAALRVAEYYDPEAAAAAPIAPDDPSVESSIAISHLSEGLLRTDHSHSLSRAAHAAVLPKRYSHPLMPLLNGPVAVLIFPTVSTDHLKAALSVLSPFKPHFPAPLRRTNPGLYEPQVQAGISKLMLLGARVEGAIFDVEKTRWVGTIGGGVDGLRSQLVMTLQGAGTALVSNLELASKTLFFTMESRRSMLEEEPAISEAEA